MKVSVIIPTHDPKYLKATLDSVAAQTYQDYEVVVVPNNLKPGTKLVGVLPDKVRVVEYGGPPLVGAVKRFAFMQAAGDILLELDHDDLLMPVALEKVVEKFKESGAGFVYSDFAEFNEDGSPREPWSEAYGWKHRKETLLGKNCTVYQAPEPSPAAMGRVEYAPNHVRAWTRAAYKKAGGHDPRLSVCDDHDLVIRTYLTTEMARVPECLYLYRVHGENTWLKRNAEIQAKSWELYSRNLEPLVLRWARKQASPLPCVELNRAYDLTAGWEKAPEADYDTRWPFADNSVGAFKAYDFLHGRADKLHVMSELYRCLAPGGWLLSFTPCAPSKGAFMDPTAKSYWNANAFWYWTNRDFSRWIKSPGGVQVRFQVQRLVEAYPAKWHEQNDVKYVTLDAVTMKEGYDGPGIHEI